MTAGGPALPERRIIPVALERGSAATAVYEVEGPPERLPVVFVHGLGAWSYTWRHLLPALSSRRRAVAADLLGHGGTEAPRWGDYSPRGLLNHVAATLSALGVERAVWAGNSLGGGLCMLAAIERPKAVAGLILIGSAGYPQKLPRSLALLQWPGARFVLQFLSPRLMAWEMVGRVFHDPSRISSADIERYTEPLRSRRRKKAVLEAGARIWPKDLEAIASRVPGVKVPTLIVWGEDDRVTPPEMALRFHREIEPSRLVMLPRTGHVPQEERPSEVASEVVAFLDGLPF